MGYVLQSMLLRDGNLLEKVAEAPPKYEEWQTMENIKVHSVADKIFKWTHLG